MMHLDEGEQKEREDVELLVIIGRMDRYNN
jgi:hypothetical protein